MSGDEVVSLTVVSSESEAAMLCGLLESAGIRATYDKGGGIAQPPAGGALTGAYAGRQQILVQASDLEAARRVLDEAAS
jgi:ribulose 1,5-bisphosphate carboxylase large subunit-like protein